MEKLYLCRRVGNDFQVVNVSPASQAWKLAMAGAGAYLAVKALRAPGLLGALCAWGGGELLARGLANKTLTEVARETLEAQFGCKPGNEPTAEFGRRPRHADGSAIDSPSFNHSFRAPATQEPKDAVEEASMESFPASDPPASHHSSAMPGEPPTSVTGDSGNR